MSVTRFRFACHELFEQRVSRHLTLTSWLGVLKTDKVGMQICCIDSRNKEISAEIVTF